MMPRRVPAVLLALLLVPFGASALSFDELDVNAGVLFIGSNPTQKSNGSINPTLGIPPIIGVSVPFRLARPLFFEAGLDFIGWFYEWNADSGAAEITQSESGTGFFTVGLLLALQGGVIFPVAEGLSIGGAVGVDVLARFPLEFQNTSATVKDGESSALSWFYDSGRFFYPEVRLFLRWHVLPPVDLVVNLRGFFPVFHAWDGSGQPFWDALMVGAGVGVGIRLK